MKWRDTIRSAASRLTLGIVLAALIVGAALLMRVQTGPELLGYPAVAIVFFLVAGLGGLLLAGQIVLESFRSRHRSHAPR